VPEARRRPSADQAAAASTYVRELDLESFALRLKERRGESGLSIRQAAASAEVSFMTLSRVESGAQPDLTTFLRLCAWLRVAPETFFASGARREASTVEVVTAAAKIASMVRDLYSALASEPIARPTVACHLRAASLLRPGVSERLGSLLTDMQERLVELDASGVL
jgi:transcriptional regulator with XRE-family HTH domain